MPATCSTLETLNLFIVGFHDSPFIPIPVPVLNRSALVECLFTSSQGNLELHPMAFSVHGDSDASLAFLLCCGGQARQLPLV